MLIRWATEQERLSYGFDSSVYQFYDVLIAVDRMTNNCLGILGFSREKKVICEVVINNNERKDIITDALTKCAKNQIEPKGASFHYRFPQYMSFRHCNS